MPKVVKVENAENVNTVEDMPVKKSKSLLSIKQAHKIALGYIYEIKEAEKYNEDNEKARDDLAELVERVISQERQSGNPEEFHNFSVTLGRVDDNLACEILKVGRERYKMNVDLLADYIIYGMDCDRIDECKECFDTLNTIPKNEWTWRSFQFVIAYLYRMLDICSDTNERVKIRKKISQTAKEYKKYLPLEEGGYREIARTYSPNADKELKELNEVLSSNTIACPSCAFRAADILFTQKKYKEALDAVERSKEDAINQIQGGIDEYQLRFMSALCKIAIHITEHIEFTEDAVLEIYSDFNMALKGLKNEFREAVKIRTHFLEGATSIYVSDDFEELKALISY